MKQNKRVLLSGLSVFGLTTMMLSANVQITSFTQTLSAEAFSSSSSLTDLDVNSTAVLPISNAVVSASEGVASSVSSIDYSGSTGFPTALNRAVTGFDLQFEASVQALVLTGTDGSSSEASAVVNFTVEVLSGTYDFIFSNTGSNADIRYIVDGTIATNVEQTLTLGVGSYNVAFSDGASAITEDVNQEDSEQLNAQNYNLQVVAVPEPSSTALLGLGGLVLLARRKRA